MLIVTPRVASDVGTQPLCEYPHCYAIAALFIAKVLASRDIVSTDGHE